MTIAKNIKTIRERYGLSQKEFADIAGVTNKAVSSWENGTKEPRMGPIERIANHFGLKKSDIIDNQDIETKIITDGSIVKVLAILMKSKENTVKDLKLEIIKDFVQIDMTIEQLKALSAFIKTMK
jgi:transcriptional regulator with XRE-family HTH domain